MPLIPVPPALVRPLTPAAPTAVNMAAITGAAIDERLAQTVITVMPATLRAGMQQAHDNLAAGIATKVVLRPGVYRADLSELTWDAGKARETLLIIQGIPGKTVWTGSDVFPLSTWKRQGDLLVHDWPYKFGNSGPYWGPKKNIARRSEMAFAGGGALRQEVLETYKVNGGPKLRDPKNDDFRLSPDSPLTAEAARWPSYALPAAKRRELMAFWKWLRVISPDEPGMPPADEP